MISVENIKYISALMFINCKPLEVAQTGNMLYPEFSKQEKGVERY